jgi:hypothetical protein
VSEGVEHLPWWQVLGVWCAGLFLAGASLVAWVLLEKGI